MLLLRAVLLQAQGRPAGGVSGVEGGGGRPELAKAAEAAAAAAAAAEGPTAAAARHGHTHCRDSCRHAAYGGKGDE